jgi:hypothetical protein
VPFHVPLVIVPTLERLEAVVRADRVVKVAFEEAVTFEAVPVVLAALFGISAETSPLNVGCAADPVVGPAKTVLAVCVVNVWVSVPEVVTGLPVIVYIGVVEASEKATLVTVPEVPLWKEYSAFQAAAVFKDVETTVTTTCESDAIVWTVLDPELWTVTTPVLLLTIVKLWPRTIVLVTGKVTVCVVVPVKYCCCADPTVRVVVPAAVAVVA